MSSESQISAAYTEARDRYTALGVDTDRVLEDLDRISISLNCWQGDDLAGFEKADAVLSGGLQITGNYPGKARNIDELRQDLETAFDLIPGQHRLNLHAMYGDFRGSSVDRDAIEKRHYTSWVQWASEKKLKLDFNATCFSHPKADSGYTLSHRDPAIRQFWVDHVARCRRIASYFGREQKSPCIHNLWIPDGSKDNPVDRWGFRSRLVGSLDIIYAEAFPAETLKDSVESKLFGLGSEAFVVGSHEFYLGYALQKGLMICLDMGHFHPTESVADKISAILQYSPELLLHISRGVRWDSDHVVIQNDELRHIAEEVIRGGAIERVFLALDFFDASLNRIGAWVVGARSTLKSFLLALLEPIQKLRKMEEEGDYFLRLSSLEELKNMPSGAIWDYYCKRHEVPCREEWISAVKDYENGVLKKRR